MDTRNITNLTCLVLILALWMAALNTHALATITYGVKRMFEIVTTPSGCSFGSMPHSAHEWREGFLWLKRKSCPGIPDRTKSDQEVIKDVLIKAGLDSPYEPEDRIFPCSVERCEECKDAPPKEHRHFFKLTRHITVGDDPTKHYVGNWNVAWQCECGEFRRINRKDLKVQMLSWEGIHQTWPS